MSDALDEQVGGDHYKDLAIQPFEFIELNNLGYGAGNVVKYICRYKTKGGVDDLKKARHYIDLLIEVEGQNIYGKGKQAKTNGQKAF